MVSVLGLVAGDRDSMTTAVSKPDSDRQKPLDRRSEAYMDGRKAYYEGLELNAKDNPFIVGPKKQAWYYGWTDSEILEKCGGVFEEFEVQWP